MQEKSVRCKGPYWKLLNMEVVGVEVCKGGILTVITHPSTHSENEHDRHVQSLLTHQWGAYYLRQLSSSTGNNTQEYHKLPWGGILMKNCDEDGKLLYFK